MGGLFSRGQSGSSIDRLAGMAVSQSVYGATLPIIYGKARVPVNLLDYGDFWSREETTEVQSGGKGGSQEQTTGYSYFASIIALASGCQINGIGRVWVDKDIKSTQDLGLNVFYGTNYQTPWQIWQTKHPDRSLSYSGVAYVSAVDFPLNSSGGMPNINLEVFGLFSGDHSSGCADPANVITDILTNQSHGLAVSSSLVSSMTGQGGYRNYCKSEGFYIARAFSEQKSASDHIAEILDATNSTIYVRPADSGNDMVIDVLPLCGSIITGESVDFIPDAYPVIDISADDAVGMFDDDGNIGDIESFGLCISKTKDSEAYNAHTVSFSDISREYNDASATECDDGDASAYGLKLPEPLDLKCIPTYIHASKICKYKNISTCVIREEYSIKIPICLSSILYPGLLVTLSSTNHGLEYTPMLITSIDTPEWPSDTSSGGAVEMDGVLITMRPWAGNVGATQVARDDYASPGYGDLSPAPVAGAQSGGSSPSSPPGSSVQPGATHPPYIFEPPPGLAGSGRHLWIAATGGEYWGGCNVHISLDGGASYNKIGRIKARAKYGYTTSQLTSNSTQSVGVLLDGYQQSALDGTSTQGLAAGATASIIGGEVFAFTSSSMSGPGAYLLSSLRRAMYGTKSQNHAVGERFCRLDNSIFKHESKQNIVGDVKIKLQSFNIFSSAVEPLESCSEYTYTIGGQEWPSSSSVSLEIFDSRPQITPSTSVVFVDGELSLGVGLSNGSAVMYGKKWIKASWLWDGDPPKNGFDVILHSSTSPDLSMVLASVKVDPEIRCAVFSVKSPNTSQIFCSVRSVNE